MDQCLDGALSGTIIQRLSMGWLYELDRRFEADLRVANNKSRSSRKDIPTFWAACRFYATDYDRFSNRALGSSSFVIFGGHRSRGSRFSSQSVGSFSFGAAARMRWIRVWRALLLSALEAQQSFAASSIPSSAWDDPARIGAKAFVSSWCGLRWTGSPNARRQRTTSGTSDGTDRSSLTIPS